MTSVLLEPAETAKRLHLKNVGTLAVWRSVKRYALPYVKIGTKILYREEDVEAFIQSGRYSGTDEADSRPRVRRGRRRKNSK